MTRKNGHAQRHGADDAALALIESVKQTYLNNKPSQDGYDGLSLNESFYRTVNILSQARVPEAAAHNALKQAYDTVFGVEHATELIEHAQWLRLLEVLDTELVEESRRQRVLSESMAAQVGPTDVLMFFGINAVIYRLLRHITHRKEQQIQLVGVRTPANEAISVQIMADLDRVFPSDVTIIPIGFTDVADQLATKVDRILLAPVGLTREVHLVVPKGGELLVSLAEQAQIPVMVPLALLDLYQYTPQLAAAYQTIPPSPVIQYIFVTGSRSADEVADEVTDAVADEVADAVGN